MFKTLSEVFSINNKYFEWVLGALQNLNVSSVNSSSNSQMAIRENHISQLYKVKGLKWFVMVTKR